MEPVDDELDRLLDETRAVDAADARARERWLRRQAQEDARFAGVVLDLAEAGRGVTITTTAGRQHRGRFTLVAADCVVLRDEREGDVYLALGSIAVVTPDAEVAAGPGSGDREAASTATLLELLSELSAERPDVVVAVDGMDQPLVGRLVGAGVDVVTIRLEGEPARTCFVPAQSLSSVSLPG
jgi:hypothetical protein